MEVDDVKTEADHDDNDDAPVFTHKMVVLDDLSLSLVLQLFFIIL